MPHLQNLLVWLKNTTADPNPALLSVLSNQKRALLTPTLSKSLNVISFPQTGQNLLPKAVPPVNLVKYENHSKLSEFLKFQRIQDEAALKKSKKVRKLR